MNGERELIIAAQNGNEFACEKILNLYKNRIFSYVLRLVKNYDDAEEITFEVFIKFFSTIKTFDPAKPLVAWLFSIAHNLVIDFFRKNKIEYEYLDEKHVTAEHFIEKYEYQKKIKMLEDALQQLAPVDREILILFHKEELSYQEIGKIINLPISTIKIRLHRARKKLKMLLREKNHFVDTP